MKKNTQPILGTTEYEGSEAIVSIDVDRLIDTRLVLTAMSGTGKSHAIRRILEETYGKVQHIIIDPEGEFYTLREKFPYVLAGKGGDCPADVKSAALLAQRIMELRVSTIVDIYALSADPSDLNGRVHFVKKFLTALTNIEKRHMHQCMVVLDEAHVFCPEKGEGEAESRGSVINLMSQGRKKLICGILATQRFSKLHKSAIADAHNMMIGKAILDVDVDRSMRYLGLRKGNDDTIRKMKRGHFWTFGPAFTDEVTDIYVADTVTKTPKLGTHATKPAPPSLEIQKILGQLADLPEEAAQKEQTEKDLRAEIAALKKSLRAAPAIKFAEPAPVEKTVTKIVEKAAISAKQMKSMENFVKRLEAAAFAIDTKGDVLVDLGRGVRESMLSIRDAISPPVQPPSHRRFIDVKSITVGREMNKRIQAAASQQERAAAVATTSENGKLGICARRILGVLAQYQDDGCVVGKLTLLSGYRLTGSFKNALSELRTAGLMTGDNPSVMKITPEGILAAGDVKPLPVGDELVNYWINHPSFGVCERAILKTLIEHGEAANGEQLAEATGAYKYTGSFKNALSSLRTAGVITGISNMTPIRLNDNLFQ